MHPLRRDTPDQKGCHAYGSGVLPPTTSTTADISSRHTQAAASDAATQPRNTRPAPNKRRYTRSVALHPIRRAAPDPSRYTRSEGVSCLRIGCTAPHNKHNCGQFLPTHTSGSIRRSHTTSKYPPGSEQEALHPFRRATPDQKGCHAYGSGAPPPTTNTPRT